MLKMRLLGELEVFREDRRVALPPSRKTRALLAYLAAMGGRHRRERLCAMFWDVPDDPRGALRWSLSRLRSIIDEAGTARVLATRESVGLDVTGLDIDLLALREAASQGLHRLPVERLEALAALFRGEFLEGLELPQQHEFQSWCVAERENLRRLQMGLLAELIERLNADPAAALRPARQLVQIDPFNEAARADLLRLLLAAGRDQEALRQFEAAERQFRDLGGDSVARLTRKWRELRLAAAAGPAAPAPAEPVTPVVEEAAATPAPARPAIGRNALVGRDRDLRRLVATLDTATRLGDAGATLVLGEPGMGKSRLLAELVNIARQRGVRVFTGRAYDGGIGSAYGPWAEALDGLPRAAEADPPAAGRERLFAGAVARLLGAEATPVLVALDDMHWADEASIELLHHVLRQARGHPLAIVIGLREGEVPDNPAMAALLRSLRHDGLLDEVRLAPLAAAEARTLVAQIAPGDHVERLAALSGGNPLFATELARELALDPEALPRSLTELVRARVERFPPSAAELLRWASVLGMSFPAELLQAVTGMALGDFVAALELLERHAMLRAQEGGERGGSYCFSHDLVRRAVLTGISGPRRRLMHLKVATTLAADPGGEAAFDIAFHAAAGGNAGLAAAACVRAGRRALRLFAHAEAMAQVRQGRHYAESLPNPERVERLIELAEIEAAASPSVDSAGLLARIEELAGEAIDHGRSEHARRGYTLLAKLRWEEGEWGDAERDTLQAELVSRSTDVRERVVAMAEAARYLTMLERQLPLAEALALEADALARRLEIEPDAIADAKGMLRAHQGAFEEADALFRRARLLARRDGDRVNEYLALEHLVTLQVERGHMAYCEAAGAELLALAGRMREGSELPFAQALCALGGLARQQPGASRAFEEALAALRRAESKHRLAFICSSAARLLLEQEEVLGARRLAEEALAAATAIGRPSDMAVALAILVRAGGGADPAEREALRDRLDQASKAPLSRTVRDFVAASLSPLRASA